MERRREVSVWEPRMEFGISSNNNNTTCYVCGTSYNIYQAS